MRKSICLLVVCMMLLLNTVAFAEEMPWVSVKDGIEMSKISYDNLEGGEAVENTLLTITMTAKAAEESDTVYAFVATLHNKTIMEGICADSGPIGTEPTTFEATLTLPQEDVSQCLITVALLRVTDKGLTPVSRASYCPADSKFLKLVKVSADGTNIGFDNEFNASVSLAPTANSLPEVFEVQTAEASTTVNLTKDETFPGNVYAVASLPDGTEITYTMHFFAGNHAVANALKDEDFSDANQNSYFQNNKISNEDILMSALFEGKDEYISSGESFEDFYLKLFTNLSGIDEKNGNYFGSRWVTDYDSHQVHSINYVHPELEGCDYFITRNGDMNKDTGLALFDFDLSYDSEVIIVAYNKVGSYPVDGWTESYNGDGFIRTSALDYDNSKVVADAGYDVTYKEAKAWDAKVDEMAFFSKTTGGNKAYQDACKALATSITNRHGRLVTKEDLYGLDGKLIGDEYSYKYTYSKEFKIPEGEESCNVKIYGPDTNQKRGFVVVVKPIKEDTNTEPATEPLLSAIEIDGMQIANFKPDTYSYTYEIDPRDGTLPEITGIADGTGLDINTQYNIAQNGKSATATISVTAPLGTAEYTVDMTLDEYIPEFIAEDYNIVDVGDSVYNNYKEELVSYPRIDYTVGYDNDNANAPIPNQYSSNSALITSNKNMTYGTVFTNLQTPEDLYDAKCIGPVWVYAWYNSMSKQAFTIYDVASELHGSQYFPFNHGSASYVPDGNILEFYVTKPCKVSILSPKSGSSYGDFKHDSNKTYVKAFYTTSGTRPMLVNAADDDEYTNIVDVPFGMYWDLFNDNPDKLTWDEFYDRYFNGKTSKSKDELYTYFTGEQKQFIDNPNSVGIVVNYSNAYTKTFSAGDKVVIPKDANKLNTSFSLLVVITPYEEGIADRITE